MPHFQDVIAEHDRLTAAEVARLAAHLRRAADAHHEHEKSLGHADPFWADWYAQWMVDNACGSLTDEEAIAYQRHLYED